jgi:CCR4-NOT transcription complex subunit 7/8
LLSRYPFVAIDTEYPGTVHLPPPGRSERQLAPYERYALVKAYVDELPIVQLGITLCDEYGNLPLVTGSDGRPLELAWEVTFSDFDARRDRHAPESVAFLQSQGVDFDQARKRGVSSAAFAAKLAAVLSAHQQRQRDGELTWAAFGGAHDFAYMVRMLAGGQPLPDTWHEFVAQARDLLGGRLFDAKYMAEHCERADLCGGGGLRRVATSLRVQRNLVEPPVCLAGWKSHSACRVYTSMRRRVLYRDGGASHQGLIDGLNY